MISMEKRIFLFDNLKFFLILTVVIGHFIAYITKSSHMMSGLFLFIYSFHMPFFIYLAGLFHSNHNIKNRCVSFIAIGFSMKILFALCRIVFLHKAFFSLLADPGVPWFMFTMAMFTATSYFLRDFNTSNLFILFTLLACFSGYDKSLGDYLYLSRFIVFYPFYLLGQMTNKEKVLSITQRPVLKIIGAICIIGWGILCMTQTGHLSFLLTLFTGKHSFASNEIFAFYGPIYRALCMAITIIAGFCLMCIFPNKKLPFITKAGSRTLQVFFWHYPFIYFLTGIHADKLLSDSAPGKIIWLLISILLTLLLSTRILLFRLKESRNLFLLAKINVHNNKSPHTISDIRGLFLPLSGK